MRVGSLFSGYMGLDHAVEEVFGATTAWVSDIDRGACKILAHRAPDVPNLGDITSVDWASVEPVDIVTGGSPCQDLSHAGKRQGMTSRHGGTRSNLWVAMREAIAQLRPRYVVWENVRGAYSAEADSDLESDARLLAGVRRRAGEPVLRALGRVLGDLSDLGYDCRWHGIRAADVGAPHGRFRVFVVATDTQRRGRPGWTPDPFGGTVGRVAVAGRGEVAGPTPDAAGLGHERAGQPRGRWSGPADGGLLPTPTARDFKNAGDPARTAGRMAERGQPLTEIAVNVLLPTPLSSMRQAGGEFALLPTPAVNAMGAGKTVEDWDDWTDDMKARHGNGNGHGKSLAIEAQRLLPTPKATNNENRQSEGRSERANFHGLLRGHQQWGMYAAAINRWELILGRPAPEPTRTSSKGNPQLSAHFVEFMMGLPAGWVTDVPGITRNEALKALGNGVVSQQCAAALRTMLAWEAVAS